LRRITKAALGGLAGCALVLGATQGAAGAVESTYDFARRLIDVQAAEGAFDSAKAKLWITETADGSEFRIQVDEINPLVQVPDGGFGAHLHTGSCEKYDIGGLQAGPHYQHVEGGGINRKNEMWFDLEVENGTAIDDTFVPFKVDPGAQMERAVVIHALATDEVTGLAGPRVACLPLHFDSAE
jgi:Cu/Zn superoxide dismutase